MKIDWKRIGIKKLAAAVSKKLKEKNIDAILVGGACVSIYTTNKYVSYDLDFVSHARLKDITQAMAELGFKKESSRYFVHADCPFFIEFISPPAAVGNQPVKIIKEMKTKFGAIILLSPTDCVKDRLSAFYHWNDPQALEQALMVAKAQKINLKDIKRWSEQEGHNEKYALFLRKISSSVP